MEYQTDKRASIPCRNGTTCQREGCAFSHTPKTCRYGDNCTRDGCTFLHLKDVKSSTPCRNGDKCYRPNCRFDHPEGWDPSCVEKEECRYGLRCTRKDCILKHSKKPKRRPAYRNSDSDSPPPSAYREFYKEPTPLLRSWENSLEVREHMKACGYEV